MTAFVYYKTLRQMRSIVCESPKEMWRAIHKVLGKGHIVTEVDVYDSGTHSIYTLGYTAQGEPTLKKYE